MLDNERPRGLSIAQPQANRLSGNSKELGQYRVPALWHRNKKEMRMLSDATIWTPRLSPNEGGTGSDNNHEQGMNSEGAGKLTHSGMPEEKQVSRRVNLLAPSSFLARIARSSEGLRANRPGCTEHARKPLWQPKLCGTRTYRSIEPRGPAQSLKCSVQRTARPSAARRRRRRPSRKPKPRRLDSS